MCSLLLLFLRCFYPETPTNCSLDYSTQTANGILATSNSHFHHAWAAELLLSREMLPFLLLLHAPKQAKLGNTGQKESPHPPDCFAFTSDLLIYLIFFPILLILLHSWHWSYFILPAKKLFLEDLDGPAFFVFLLVCFWVPLYHDHHH